MADRYFSLELCCSYQIILGIRPEYESLTVDPCIPSNWKGFKATREFRACTTILKCGIQMESAEVLKGIIVDGVETDRIPIKPKGTICDCLIIM